MKRIILPLTVAALLTGCVSQYKQQEQQIAIKGQQIANDKSISDENLCTTLGYINYEAYRGNTISSLTDQQFDAYYAKSTVIRKAQEYRKKSNEVKITSEQCNSFMRRGEKDYTDLKIEPSDESVGQLIEKQKEREKREEYLRAHPTPEMIADKKSYESQTTARKQELTTRKARIDKACAFFLNDAKQKYNIRNVKLISGSQMGEKQIYMCTATVTYQTVYGNQPGVVSLTGNRDNGMYEIQQ